MNLHGRIMNIQVDAALANAADRRLAYKMGHRDARHAAAELANDADRRLEAAHRLADAAEAYQKESVLCTHNIDVEGALGAALAAWKEVNK